MRRRVIDARRTAHSRSTTMTRFYVYLRDTLQYLGIVEAADGEIAHQLASVVWPAPLKVLTWPLWLRR
jgi:hypothetical protein